jgi:hypothetical protein
MTDNGAPTSLIKKEWTPEKLRCWMGQCPGVLELQDGRLLIIGKKTNSQLTKEIASRVGDDEYAIVIDREFFAELLSAQV